MRPMSAAATLLAMLALAVDATAGDITASAVRPGLMPANSPAYAQLSIDETRGALLYATHCKVCHASQGYWREKKQATDLDSLQSQVRRWQSIIGLEWTESEIADVTSYLNAVYYGFSGGGQKSLLEREAPLQALRKD